MNEVSMLRKLYNTFRFTDIVTSGDGRYSGFIDYTIVAHNMEEHGMTEDEIDLFLGPYLRVDGKIEYHYVFSNSELETDFFLTPKF